MRVKRCMLVFTVFIFFAACSASGIKKQPHNTGDTAFDFTLPNQDGEPVTLSTVLSQHRGVVIAFYPKDDTKN